MVEMMANKPTGAPVIYDGQDGITGVGYTGSGNIEFIAGLNLP